MKGNPFRRPTWIPLQTCFGLHLLAAGAYAWTGPGGFPFLSRSFIEHQVLAPLMVAASGVALVGAWRPRPAMVASGVITGFWIVVFLVMAATGTTLIARGLWPILLCVLSGFIFFLVGVRKAGESTAFFAGGTVAGLFLGGVFLACTWAPATTTTPANVTDPLPKKGVPDIAVITGDRVRVDVGEHALVIDNRDRGEPLVIFPAMEFSSASEGSWTIFQFRQVRLPPWRTARAEDGTIWFRADGEELESWGWVNVHGRRVHVRCATRVKREISAHLATAVRMMIPGTVSVEGRPWPGGEARRSFLAVRNGRLQLLRSSRKEKGPFTLLEEWTPRDPLLSTRDWNVRVRGWLDQGSREPSPTAGWGVPQATVERWESEFYWGVASTSVGRGWHAVRTREGTYVFDIEVEAR